MKRTDSLTTYAGAIHIHTKCSDGSGSLRDIVKAAQKCHLDFIVITDHNTVGYLKDGKEGFYDNLLVLIGEEVTHRKGHCLALNISESVAPINGNPLLYLKEIKRQKGLSFIAHPHLNSNPVFRIKNITWRDWSLNSYTGIEIWSYMTDWAQNLRMRNFYTHCQCPDRFISGPFSPTLRKWDELCRERRVVAIGGVDAHAKPILPWGLKKIFPYDMLFKTVLTYVITPHLSRNDFALSKKLFYEALSHGHCFVANIKFGDARSFEYMCALPDGRTLLQGDEAAFIDGACISINLPRRATIRMIHNGIIVDEKKDKRLLYKPTTDGSYRVEIYLDNKPWIFSNQIYLRRS